jgi:hypothetical protein
VVQLNVYQLRYGMFMDVLIEGTLEIGAVICRNLTLIIRDGHWNADAGFAGDFVWNDLQGTNDPVFQNLGTRYQLLYLTEADLKTLGVTTE